MIKSILKNWNFMRFVRLAFGIVIIVQAALAKDWTMGILGLAFTSMPVFNIGCCAANNCSVPTNKNKEEKEAVTYEEVV